MLANPNERRDAPRKIMIKIGNNVKIGLSEGNVIEGKIVEISTDDVKIVKE